MDIKRVIMGMVVLLLAAALPGCRESPHAEVSARGEATPWERGADLRWPRSATLKEYERALELYRAGELEQGLALVRRLVAQPLRLAPDSVLEDEWYYTYQMGRFRPATGILSAIHRQNRDQATQVARAGRSCAALDLHSVNLLIARQMVHIQPADSTALIGGTTLWRTTWLAIDKELRDAGDAEKATCAAECAQAAKRFVCLRIHPFVKQGQTDLTKIEGEGETIPAEEAEQHRERRLVEWLRNRQAELRRLIELWDIQVDTPPCRDMMEQLGCED